jgi:two-component system sensor histidine kinase VanS
MSIRIKLFLWLSCLVIFFVISSWLLNSQYLGTYYIWQKEEILLNSKMKVATLYKGDPEGISFELENLEQNRGLNIYFLDTNYEMKYSSSFGNNVGFKSRLMERLPLIYSIQPKLRDLSGNNYITDVVMDPRLKTEFLVLAARLKNGDLLVLSTPISAINESTTIANRFFLFTGLLTIILGGVAVFLFANRFTKPIMEVNDIAQRMSRLDFSKKYPVQSKDEVGQLGMSINSLSEQLHKAISELTEANKKLIEDIEHERRIDKMRKEFISNVSHELKTPLALIQGYAEGLKLNVNEDQENRDFYCDVIMDETDKMNRLVKDLLDLSQIESGYFKVEKTNFDISSLVEYVFDKYQPIFMENGIKVKVQKPENAIVNGDVIRIEQVLANYINNAINHIDENRIIETTIIIADDKVRVSVYNSGKIIPDESLKKIWISFYKVDKARTRVYGGTGLGLSVVRAIMELHHNAFGVDNQENGVLFWFELDLADKVCSQNKYKKEE